MAGKKHLPTGKKDPRKHETKNTNEASTFFNNAYLDREQKKELSPEVHDAGLLCCQL